MPGLNAGLASTGEETLQSLVLESHDHTISVTWVVTGHKALSLNCLPGPA
jgi:hypothetical protein